MSEVGALVLLFGGLVGLSATWNAARPLRDPTRWYSPSWLPSMVVTELAPFWTSVHLAVLGFGLWLGGWDNWGGRIGAALVVVSTLLLCWVIVRTVLGVRRLRQRVVGPVLPARGWARLFGRPVSTPRGVVEGLGVDWAPGLTLDMTQPADRPRRTPVLVYVHGGGWTGGDPQRQARDLYHALALDGWTVLAVRYPFTPAVSVEQQIETIRRAVRWARRELPSHGVEAGLVAIAGGSAGGHLAAMATLTASDDDERVDAFVGVYGIYDMANRNRTRAPWAKIRNEVMHATVSEAPERYRAVSPIDQIHDGTPPMLILHGTHDTLVTVAESVRFADAVRSAGQAVDFVPVPGAQHAWDAVSSPMSRTTAALVRDWLGSIVAAADR